MKKLITFTLAVVLLTASGCAITPGATPQTPAQIATQVCPPIESGLAALQTAGLSPTDTTALAKITPLVTAACSSTATINLANLQALGNTGFPAVQAIISASSLPSTTKQKATTDLLALQIVFDAVLAADPAANVVLVPSTTTTPTTTVTSTTTTTVPAK